MLDILFGAILLYAVLAFVGTYLIVPLLLREPLIGILRTIGKEADYFDNEKFSALYVCKTLLRYLFWGFIANIAAFFLGGFALGLINYLAQELITPILENLLGIF